MPGDAMNPCPPNFDLKIDVDTMGNTGVHHLIWNR
jgi:hypothetical protein